MTTSRRLRPRLVRAAASTVLLAVAVVAALAATGPSASAATPVPPTPTGLPAGIEALSSYVGANSCDAKAKPGTVALGSLLVRTYPGTTYGSARACGSDSLATSEHYDGRAVDWMASVRNTTQKAQANAALTWMLATDRSGNTYAMARRLGVMYLIWNNKTWSAYRPQDGWTEYQGCLSSAKASTSYDTACHRNHVHISLSWSGAMQRSSYWSKKVASPEWGPCRSWALNWASPRSSANLTRCQVPPPVKAVPSASSLGKQLVSFSGMYLRSGSTGPAVQAVQSAIGSTASGSFGSTTQSALTAWQKRQGVTATGVTDAATWRALVRPYAAPPVSLGLDAAIDSDLVSLSAARGAVLHDSPADTTGRSLGGSWGSVTDVVTPGDFTGDAVADLVTRTAGGDLFLLPGTGNAAFGAPVRIGSGWGIFDTVVSPGDFTGDGRPDVVARRKDGTLWLYRGTSKGLAATETRIATGWQVFDRVFSPGDVTGDARPDLLARRRSDGTLWLYAGNGKGGWSVYSRQVGTGWQPFVTLTGAGDLNRDGLSDVLALNSSGAWMSYYGNGKGGWLPGSGAQVGRAGWPTDATYVGAR
ncbi:hypothetical protein GCM10025782_12130 [Pedococcus ginsenosidimutans]|uniref:Peptidoglycan binding-like domain-containing protein n=1 Tax=Pedococcus ginsenosidimutans TaxID=490570 RepID=A0ABP8XWD9_9MICO